MAVQIHPRTATIREPHRLDEVQRHDVPRAPGITADHEVAPTLGLQGAIGGVKEPGVDPRAATLLLTQSSPFRRHKRLKVAAFRRLAPDHPMPDGGVAARGRDGEVGEVLGPARCPLRPAPTVGPGRRLAEQHRDSDSALPGLENCRVEFGGPAVGGIPRIARIRWPSWGDRGPRKGVLVDANA